MNGVASREAPALSTATSWCPHPQALCTPSRRDGGSPALVPRRPLPIIKSQSCLPPGLLCSFIRGAPICSILTVPPGALGMHCSAPLSVPQILPTWTSHLDTSAPSQHISQLTVWPESLQPSLGPPHAAPRTFAHAVSLLPLICFKSTQTPSQGTWCPPAYLVYSLLYTTCSNLKLQQRLSLKGHAMLRTTLQPRISGALNR